MNARIKINSIIDGEEFLSSYDGSVTFLENVTLLTYDELLDSDNCSTDIEDTSSQTISTSIKISQAEVLIEKSGALTTRMHFLPGEKTETLYRTPFGDMPMQIECDSLYVDQSSSLVTAKIAYKLLNNGDIISTHELNLEANLR